MFPKMYQYFELEKQKQYKRQTMIKCNHPKGDSFHSRK